MLAMLLLAASTDGAPSGAPSDPGMLRGAADAASVLAMLSAPSSVADTGHGGRPAAIAAASATASPDGGPPCDRLDKSAMEPATAVESTAAPFAGVPSAAVVNDSDSDALTRGVDGEGPTMLDVRSLATTAPARDGPRKLPLTTDGLKSERAASLLWPVLPQRLRPQQKAPAPSRTARQPSLRTDRAQLPDLCCRPE